MEPTEPTALTGGRWRLGILLAALTTCVALVGGVMVWRAGHNVNRVPLAGAPRPVSVLEARAGEFRDGRTYVGTTQPWVESNVGPQFISAYIDTVLVRPGDRVAAKAVVATLDCSNASAVTAAAEMQARGVAAQQRALADEATRVNALLEGGFAAANDAEKSTARSNAQSAELGAARARLAAAALDVRDCILRAPFDGEVATRSMDPGAFAHPGAAIVSIVDRNTLRVVADAPEKDFELVAPGNEVSIEVLSTHASLKAPITRRAPKADPSTRTVHIEIDVDDRDRAIPCATTALVRIDVGEAVRATEVPLYAAAVTERKATVFVVEDGIARTRDVKVVGEKEGLVFVDPEELPPGTSIVSQGRALIQDGDRVVAKPESAASPAPSPSDRGGGVGWPQ